MTKASDNPFPSLLITEGTEPAAPAAGKQRVYIDSTTHHLMRTNSGGTETDIESALLPWHVSIIPMVWTPDATVGTWGLTGFSDASTTYPFVKTGATPNESATALFNSSTAQNDAIAWDVILAAGTWDAHFYVRKTSNTGIITLNQDGVSAGTVDTYNASGVYAKVSITGFTVSTTGKKRMQVLVATKNASSSGYIAELFAIEFRRTA